MLSERDIMRVPALLKKLSWPVKSLLRQERGQNLVEYALLIALIAFAATAGMTKLATGITTAFSNISKQLSTSIT